MFNRIVIALVLIVSLTAGNLFAHQRVAKVSVGIDNGSLTRTVYGSNDNIILTASDYINLEYDSLSGAYISDVVGWVSNTTLNSSGDKPNWNIKLNKISSTTGLIALNDDFQQILNPDDYLVGAPVYSSTEGWHFHTHLFFAATDVNVGDEFIGNFKLYDAGGIYAQSPEIQLNFRVIPEPATMIFLVSGAVALFRKKLIQK